MLLELDSARDVLAARNLRQRTGVQRSYPASLVTFAIVAACHVYTAHRSRTVYQIPGRHDNNLIDVSRRSEGYVRAFASFQHCYTTTNDFMREV